MALAPFFERVSQSIGSVANISHEQLVEVLEDVAIRLSISDRASTDPAVAAGASLLTNLVARLYPRLHLDGPSEVVEQCADLARRVNPSIDLNGKSAQVVSVLFGEFDTDAVHAISTSASGWSVHIDEPAPRGSPPATPFAALAAACVAAAELFRVVFADGLGRRGRRRSQPGSFDLITQRHDALAPYVDVAGLVLPRLHLVGAGAVGEACLLALRASGASGHVTVVDPQTLEMSNLQRYVLSVIDDVGARKVDIAARALKDTAWTIEGVPTVWGADDRSAPRRDDVLVALDSARDRLGVAAGLHRRIYNAWTQPADLGWSRHERFGEEPCLACLYYPDHLRPSDDEQVARAIRQHRLRVLSYFVTGTPVGLPLPTVSQAAGIVAPPESEQWVTVPLLADLVGGGVIRRGPSARVGRPHDCSAVPRRHLRGWHRAK